MLPPLPQLRVKHGKHIYYSLWYLSHHINFTFYSVQQSSIIPQFKHFFKGNSKINIVK